MPDTATRTQADGVQLAVRRHLDRQGRPVLLLHGAGSDVAGTWELSGWLRMLDRAQLPWLAPDLRGHGASAKPHDPASYALPALVTDVRAVLDDANVGTAAVVGYSLGARVAFELAATLPQRVSRLVLGGFGGARPSPEQIELLLAHLGSGVDRAAVRACVEGVDASASELPVTRVKVPTLLIAGEHDAIAGAIEALAGRLPAAHSVRVPGRNHFTTLSAAAFKDAARDFLLADRL